MIRLVYIVRRYWCIVWHGDRYLSRPHFGHYECVKCQMRYPLDWRIK